MNEISVTLSRGRWTVDFDRQLGSAGGFGAVYAGRSEAGEPVAIKRLHINASEAGGRELRVADLLVDVPHQHVIPILDAGVAADGRYYLVMALAEKSLRQELRTQKKFSVPSALAIALEVVDGLIEVKDVVHRDLKPDNVLRHEGNWKLADFGIAKFVEESTSLNTLKEALSPPYAAPEQWRLEMVTHATDVYAVGCIVHELITGSTPFVGSVAELQAQHLVKPPPSVMGDPRLITLVAACLSKSPQSRPTLEALGRSLRALLTPAPVHEELARAAAQIARASSKTEAEAMQAHQLGIQRQELLTDAWHSFGLIAQQMQTEILASAPGAIAEWNENVRKLSVRLGNGQLTLKPMSERWQGQLPRSRWDIICGAVVLLGQAGAEYPGRSANLWFCRIPGEPDYRWREVSYMTTPVPGTPQSRRDEPFGFRDPNDAEHVDRVAGPGLHIYQFGSPVLAIDRDDVARFKEKWIRRLAQAAMGQLARPDTLPDRE